MLLLTISRLHLKAQSLLNLISTLKFWEDHATRKQEPLADAL